MDALNEQVGGNHYKNTDYQPIQFCEDIHATYIQGSIIKYVFRYKQKNGKEDLQKALHYAELAIQLNHKNTYSLPESKDFQTLNDYSEKFSAENNLQYWQSIIITDAACDNYQLVIKHLKVLIDREYNSEAPCIK